MKWIKSLLARRKPTSDIFDEPTNKELLKELKEKIEHYEWQIKYHKDQTIYYKQKMVLTKIAMEVLERNKCT